MFIDLGHINFLVDSSLIWIYIFFTCSQTQDLVIWSWLPKRYFSVPQTSGVHLLSPPLRSYFHHFSPPRLTFLETLLTPSPSTFGQLPNVIGISFIVGFSFVFSFLEPVPLLPPIFSSIILWTSSREKLLLGCLNVTYPLFIITDTILLNHTSWSTYLWIYCLKAFNLSQSTIAGFSRVLLEYSITFSFTYFLWLLTTTTKLSGYNRDCMVLEP